MIRCTLARCLVFTPRVEGAKQVAGRMPNGSASRGSSHAPSSSSQASGGARPNKRRGFLVTPTHKMDPHTRPPPRPPVDGGRTLRDDPYRQGVDKVSSRLARNAGASDADASNFDPLQSPAEARLRRKSRHDETQSSKPQREQLPSDYYETKEPNSAERRASRMRDIIKKRTVSSVEITKGGESDIDFGGLPRSEYHGKDGWTTVPEDSSMYQNIINKDALPSREAYNSWGVLKKQQEQQHPSSTFVNMPKAASPAAAASNAPQQEEFLQSRTGSADEWRRHNGTYRTTFDDTVTLSPMRDAISYSRSTYALRKLYLDGLCGYMDIITQHEELSVAEEVMKLTQSPTACYVAEEARYCVNLVDHATPLGVPSRDPLAFPLNRCPALMTVLQRLVDLELIACMPNVVQLSEFVGTFSGYPPHRKPHTIGPYLGLLNLVSPAVLQTRHVQHPWAPRMMLQPRSLFVFEPPCLQEYAVGYAATHQPFHNFDFATRIAADYRIEVLFASVDIPNTKLLRETVAMTEYAASKRLLPTTAAAKSGSISVDDAIQRLSSTNAPRTAGATPTALQAKELLGGHVGSAVPLRAGSSSSQGDSPTESSGPAMSPSKRRIMELKARHQLVQEQLRGGSDGVLHHGGGNVIQGHKPGPRKL